MSAGRLTLGGVDAAGVLAEAATVLPTTTRTGLLRSAIGGAAAMAAGLATPVAARSEPSSANDTEILRFDLVLEYLQAALYTEAERLGQLSPHTLGWARVVGAHERAHAAAIRSLLGRKAVPSPSFDFRGVTSSEDEFVKTAVAFEDLTAALLKWQAPRLVSRSIVAAVATLHTVETRHAAWIRRILGLRPAAHAFDEPASQERMARLIASTRFITRSAATSGSGTPGFTG
jgi:Ferritin-like domain